MSALFDLSPVVVYGVVALAVAVSSLPLAALVVPAELALAFGAVFIANGHGSLGVLLATASAAAVLGDVASHVVGRRMRNRDHLAGRTANGRVVQALRRRLAAANRQVRTRPLRTLLLQRWFPPGRGTGSMVSGYRGYRIARFLMVGVVGAALWVGGIVGGVSVGGAALAVVAPLPMIALLVVRVIRRRRARRDASPAPIDISTAVPVATVLPGTDARTGTWRARPPSPS